MNNLKKEIELIWVYLKAKFMFFLSEI